MVTGLLFTDEVGSVALCTADILASLGVRYFCTAEKLLRKMRSTTAYVYSLVQSYQLLKHTK